MGVYFYCTAWVFAEKPEELDVLTEKEMLEISVKYYDKLTFAEVESRAPEIMKRNPLSMRVESGGKYGHCFDVKGVSKLHPNLLFVVYSGADCTNEGHVFLCKNGQEILSYECTEDDWDIGEMKWPDLQTATYSEVNKLFESVSILEKNGKNILITEGNEIYFLEEENHTEE